MTYSFSNFLCNLLHAVKFSLQVQLMYYFKTHLHYQGVKLSFLHHSYWIWTRQTSERHKRLFVQKGKGLSMCCGLVRRRSEHRGRDRVHVEEGRILCIAWENIRYEVDEMLWPDKSISTIAPHLHESVLLKYFSLLYFFCILR